ncbi:MAG: hypothetical protein ABR878_14535 [Roseiarcus sp.]
MSEEASAEDVDDLVGLFKKSFPDIHCLRCGYQSFYILPATRQTFMMGDPALSPTLLPVITLACRRCGHIEQHLSEQLSDKPIPIEIEKSAEP